MVCVPRWRSHPEILDASLSSLTGLLHWEIWSGKSSFDYHWYLVAVSMVSLAKISTLPGNERAVLCEHNPNLP